MLVLPLNSKINWRNPPLVTMAVILINCLAYFGFQAGDPQRYQRALAYYFESGLAEIEIAQYLDYLATRGDGEAEPPPRTDRKLPQEALETHFRAMRDDLSFLRRLKSDQIITPGDAIYGEWKQLRSRYDAKISAVVTERFAFKPAYHRALTFLTSMFLHGGFAHLLGNMVFLWLVGCMLEIGWGRLRYFGSYILCGILATAFFWLFNMNSTVSLIGASGAISGLMGAFAVLYGRTRVQIFLYLGFYFDYLKFRAIWLLPVWLGYEIYNQLSHGQAGHVAYLAHIGGLAGGAFLGYVTPKLFGMADQAVFEEEPEDKTPALLQEALTSIEQLDWDRGRRLLAEVLAAQPGNITALRHLYNVEKQNPAAPRFHEVARKLLSALSREVSAHGAVHEIYQEYRRLAKPPRISAAMSMHLSTVFAGTGHLETSRKILAALLKKRPDLPGIPTALMRLANAYRTRGMQKECNQCLRVIGKRYPHSSEAQMIARTTGD